MKDPSSVTKPIRILRALSGFALLAAFLFNSHCATTALSTRTKDGPIRVFELGQRIPRNSKILNIEDSSGNRNFRFLIGHFGSCRYKPIIRQLKEEAKASGGNAVAILHVKKGLCLTIKALLLDMIDLIEWPRVGLTEEEIRRDFNTRERMVDIEGIWDCHVHTTVMMDAAALKVAEVSEPTKGEIPYGGQIYVRRVPPSVIQAMQQLSPEQQSSYRVAIFKGAEDPNYPYAAYILDPEIPEWQAGFLKARLRKLPDSSGYEAKWYGSTFQADVREFHPDETGALKTKVVIEQGLKYSIEQTLTKVFPLNKAK